MDILVNEFDKTLVEGKYIFIDTNVLSLMFRDKNLFKFIIHLFGGSYLLIYRLVRFEFLQTVFIPEQRIIKEKFIDNSDFFLPSEEHQSIFEKTMENALSLSYLYAHKDIKGAGIVDLLLAARALIQYPRTMIITENRKHFPGFLFDTIAVVNYEDKNNKLHNLSLLYFNENSYHMAIEELSSLK